MFVVYVYASLQSQGDGLSPAVHLQLTVDIGNIIANCSRTQCELSGDLVVLIAMHHGPQYF